MDQSSAIFFTPMGFGLLSIGLVASIALASRPVIGLVAVVVLAVLVEYATLNWTLMAGMATLFVTMIGLGVLHEKRREWVGRPARLKTAGDKYFAAIAIFSIIYLVVGIVRGNGATFLLGDFYHLVFELCIPFFLCTAFIKSREDLERFNTCIIWGMLALAIVVLVLYFSGAIQNFEGGGMAYRRTEIWRLRLSHNFPLAPLLWILPLWLIQGAVDRRRIAGLSAVFVLAALVVTLKRTAWIAAVVVALFYVTQIDAKDRARVVGTIVAIAFVAIVVVTTLVPAELLQGGLDFEQYAEVVTNRFSTHRSDIDTSVGNRQTELITALEIAMKNPFGHGLGSEFDVQQRMGQLFAKRHYIHNSFIHYWLQAGILVPILILMLSFKVATTAFRVLRFERDRMLRATMLSALGAYAGVFVASMTELSIHTFFFPYSAAVVFIVDRVAAQQREQDQSEEASQRRVVSGSP